MVADPLLADLARGTLNRARDHLLGLQHAEGWWQGELETNVTMDAEDLLLREFLGLHDDAVIASAARWIRYQQREDGTWANFYGGPADLSTTVEAYLALRLAGDDLGEPHLKLARDWIVEQGGVEATRVFTRIWLALSGLWSWDDLPVIPPELIYLPSWFPLNIYDWGCWARQTIVALAVVQSFRPSRPIGLSIDELKTGGPHGRAPRPRRDLDARPVGGTTSAADPWAPLFSALDKALHAADRSFRRHPPLQYRPVKSVPAGRAAALRRVDHRPAGEGRLLGRHPAALGVLADGAEPARLRARPPGHGQGHRRPRPVHHHRGGTAGPGTPPGGVPVAGLGHRADHDRAGRRGPGARRPVADPGRPVGTRTRRSAGPGDWQVRRPGTAAGGWAFEFDNDNYPDTDDTAEVVLALRRVAVPSRPPSTGAWPG